MVKGEESTSVVEALLILMLIKREDKRSRPNPEKTSNGGNGQSCESKNNSKKDNNAENKGSGKNPCQIPGHSGHKWKDCIYNPKSSNFKGVARTLKDYKDRKLKKSAKEREESHQVENASSKSGGNLSEEEANYNSNSNFEEFHMTKARTAGPKIDAPQVNKDNAGTPLSAEVLVSIPIGVGSKKFVTSVGLVDTGSSGTLASEEFVGPRCRRRKSTGTTGWTTQAGNFHTLAYTTVENLKLPSFTTKRAFTQKVHLFQKGSGHYDFIFGQDTL